MRGLVCKGIDMNIRRRIRTKNELRQVGVSRLTEL